MGYWVQTIARLLLIGRCERASIMETRDVTAARAKAAFVQVDSESTWRRDDKDREKIKRELA